MIPSGDSNTAPWFCLFQEKKMSRWPSIMTGLLVLGLNAGCGQSSNVSAPAANSSSPSKAEPAKSESAVVTIYEVGVDGMT